MSFAKMLDRIAHRSVPAWGKEMPEEGLMDCYAIRAWEDVECDHFIRFYPHLVPHNGQVPAPVIRQLEACVAERMRRRTPPRAPTTPASLGAEHMVASYPPAGRLSSWLARQCDIEHARQSAAREDAELLILEGVLKAVRSGRIGDPQQTALFAYVSGIHPAYFWPAAAVTWERDAAAGWLGVLARGWPATMPNDIAAFFLDGIIERRGVWLVRDRVVADLISDIVRPDLLRRVAERTQRGGRVVVRRTILSQSDRSRPPVGRPRARSARSSHAPGPRLRGVDPCEANSL